MTKTKALGILALGGLLLASAAEAKAKTGKTQLELQVKPATALLFVDDKPQGKVGTNRVVDVTPGFHIIRVTSKGDEHEERVKFAPNQKTTYTFEFDDAPAPATDSTPDPVSPDSEEKKSPSAEP